MRISLPSWRRRQKPADADPLLSMFPSEAALTPLSQEVVAEAARHARARLAGGPRASVAVAKEAEPVTVAVVLTRRVRVSWIEGVAIVAAAAAQVGDGPIPDSSGVILNADGTIELRAGRHNLGVEQFARTLHALVSSEPIPAPLRLFISKWVTPDNPRAIKEFAAELAYFASPDGAALIRAVYERCLATPEPAAIEAKATPPTPPREPEQTRKHAVPTWMAVAAAVIVAGAGGAWASWTMQSNGATGTALKNLVARAQSTLGGASSSTPSSAPAASAPAASSATPAAAASNAKAGAVARAIRRPLAPTPAGGVTPRLEAPESTAFSAGLAPSSATSLSAALADVPSTTPASAAPLGPTPSGTGPTGAAFASPTTTAIESASVTQRLYSTVDADVQPPQMIYPSLPPVLSPFGAINTMEVVVSPQGSVERVRLISMAQRMTDMMLLSGAKTWRFLPATREGQPVRYRMTVTWSATP